jgi:hypothetical protein
MGAMGHDTMKKNDVAQAKSLTEVGVMNPKVTEYISKLSNKANQEWQYEVCRSIHQVFHQSIPRLEERVQHGKPHYLKNCKYACAVGTAKEYVLFTIFNARTLEAPEGLFEPGDPGRRTIKIRKGQKVNYDLLGKLLQQAANSSASLWVR